MNSKRHNIKQKKYVVYVNPNSGEADRWGTQTTTATSYKVMSTSGTSIEPEASHDVVVSLFVQVNHQLGIELSSRNIIV